jgi:hypothetical protein
MARINHTPDPNPTRAKARARRNINLVLWWGSSLILLFGLSIGWPWILILPLGVIGVLVVTNTIQVVRGDGAEQFALPPGRLVRADKDDDPAVVPATRAPDRRERGRRRGSLAYGNGRLTFTTVPHTDRGRKQVRDPLTDALILEARPQEIALGPRPNWFRPQLVLTVDGVVHVIEFTMPNDLAAGTVGSVVSTAWFDQLVELGARPAGSGTRN